MVGYFQNNSVQNPKNPFRFLRKMCNLDCLMMKMDRFFDKIHQPHGMSWTAMPTAETCLVRVSVQQNNLFPGNHRATDQMRWNTFFGKSLRNGVKIDCFQTERGLYYSNDR